MAFATRTSAVYFHYNSASGSIFFLGSELVSRGNKIAFQLRAIIYNTIGMRKETCIQLPSQMREMCIHLYGFVISDETFLDEIKKNMPS